MHAALLLALLPAAVPAPQGIGEEILPLRARAELRDQLLAQRLDELLPKLMRRAGIDLWIVACREYNEDPLFRSLAPAGWLNARRRTILVFHDRGERQGVERLAVARYSVGDFYEGVWDPENEPDQWLRLAQLVNARDPKVIGLNFSETFALADGLSFSETDALVNALPKELRGRVVSAEALAIGWLEARIPAEMEIYPAIVRIAHGILAEGLSERVVRPGVTTTKDLEWWFRERIAGLRLSTWFHPSVSLQREGADAEFLAMNTGEKKLVIEPGDFLHVDFGITYLGLNTDTQQHAYLLRPGETAAPAGLLKAFAKANRLQDILTAHFHTGRSGNEVLAAALAQAKSEGIRPLIYTHPLGFHGHGAGATIGLWDRQEGVAGRGDYPVNADTVWSIELSSSTGVPEWGGQRVLVMLEEDAFFDGEKVTYLDGRQTTPFLIPSGR